MRVSATRLRIGVQADLVALAALSGLMLALALLTWGTWGDLGRDTGYDLVAGARVAHGQAPYSSFVYYYGPLAPALLGLSAWLGGGGLAPAIALGSVLSAAIVGATYALARTWLPPLGAALPAAITAAIAFSPGNFSFVLPHTYSAPLAVLTTLAFLISLARFAVLRRPAWLLAAGLAAGLVALTRPEFELAVGLAAALWLALRARAGLGARRELVLLAGPAIAIPALVYGAFLIKVSVHRLLFENLYPVDTLRQGGNAVLKLHAPLTLSSFLALGGRLALYGAGIAAILLLGLALQRASRRRLAWGCVGGVAAALALAAVLRPETLRYWLEFVYGWIPAGAVLAVGFLTWSVVRSRRMQPAQEAELAGAAVLAVLAAETYAAFFMQASRPQPAVYAIPFAAIFLARLHLGRFAITRSALVLGGLWLAFLAASSAGLALKDARAASASVRGPGGSIAAAPADAAMYRSALAWIARTTRPGDPVLIAPQLTALYTLSDRSDPLPEISLLPGALPSARAERTAIGTLEAQHVRLFVIDRHRFSEYGQSQFGISFDRILARWIHQHAVHLATLTSPRGPRSHTLDIWLRSETQ
ncbi:MAG: hypothetical protein ACXVY3_02670 [Gaiellaceae bacterium]